MTVENAGFCEYCRRSGHAEDDCPTARSDRRWERVIGFLVLALMSVFAFVGILAGLASGAFLAGFRGSHKCWDEAVEHFKNMRKKKATDA